MYLSTWSTVLDPNPAVQFNLVIYTIWFDKSLEACVLDNSNYKQLHANAHSITSAWASMPEIINVNSFFILKFIREREKERDRERERERERGR